MAVATAQGDGFERDVVYQSRDGRLRRRAPPVFMDAVPVDRAFQKPKVIYRRISKKRPVKSKYRPSHTKLRPSKYRKPGKIHIRNSFKHSRPSPTYKRPQKQKGPPKRVSPKPVYGPPKGFNFFHNKKPESVGFGEPPTAFEQYPKQYDGDYTRPPSFDGYTEEPNFEHDFTVKPNSLDGFGSNFNLPFSSKINANDLKNLKQSYGEPPVDSYGAPLKPNLHDLTFGQVKGDITGLDQDYYTSDLRPINDYNDHKLEASFANTKKRPVFLKPDSSVLKQEQNMFKPESNLFISPKPDDIEELKLNSYSDIYSYRNNKQKRKRPTLDKSKSVSKPWKGKKKIKEENFNDEIIVGGQYAEPPGRIVSKSSSEIDIDDLHHLDMNDPDGISTMSSYINYKNSNLAFSPQNLNDAFSIH